VANIIEIASEPLLCALLPTTLTRGGLQGVSDGPAPDVGEFDSGEGHERFDMKGIVDFLLVEPRQAIRHLQDKETPLAQAGSTFPSILSQPTDRRRRRGTGHFAQQRRLVVIESDQLDKWKKSLLVLGGKTRNLRLCSEILREFIRPVGKGERLAAPPLLGFRDAVRTEPSALGLAIDPECEPHEKGKGIVPEGLGRIDGRQDLRPNRLVGQGEPLPQERTVGFGVTGGAKVTRAAT
jgi:hypothetical protein